ncbi:MULTISPECIES: NAD(P)-dependent oxidoreductase [Arthrobacter]|uniref:NAD(P)-dependent oxidoreductase n=1 Tax=Arthrobacter terricola TaxID=2547396 RepID=A0A4R5K9J7_9MICC|nr:MULTISPECIES: NAD(P)-dependent oxidoreductase [Arthrobacter]MBT8163465.1 NAD(P)-dependent oxidoreductase [Arthrobacter sp. GN70]TDF89761.1 NAD(P)-dependent oxidoreductase [Arthrobacter terricola]
MEKKKLRVLVTGVNGKLGDVAVEHLLAAGHEVVGVDLAPARNKKIISLVADLTDYGQTVDVLGSVGWDILGDTTDKAFDVVVHLAAIPHPRMHSNAETFRNNVVSAYNVFEACRRLGLKDIVYASSETTLGVPFSTDLPYLPLDEDAPLRGRNAYGLSKVLAEVMAAEFAKNDPELRVTALRFSYVQNVEEYAEYPSFANDIDFRIWDLWAYIDNRDAARAIEKALHYTPRGFETFLIVADDTAMPIPTKDLIAARFPDVDVKRELTEFESLLNTDAAKEKLGFTPRHSWREHV